MQRFNELWTVRIIPEGFAQLTNRHRQHRLADRDLGPDRIEERRLRHQLFRMLDEVPQDGKGFPSERNLLRTTPKLLVDWIEMKEQGNLGLPRLHTSLPTKI